MSKDKAEPHQLRAGDIVQYRGQTGEVTIGQLPVRPVGFREEIPLSALCRVCWDGSVISVIEDSRDLTVVKVRE